MTFPPVTNVCCFLVAACRTTLYQGCGVLQFRRQSIGSKRAQGRASRDVEACGNGRRVAGRWRRLCHDPLPDVGRSDHHAGRDADRQSRALRLRHVRRLSCLCPGRDSGISAFSPPCRSRSSATMLLGAVLERSVYRWVYATGQLGQILMTLGLVFIFVASGNLFSRLRSACDPAARLADRSLDLGRDRDLGLSHLHHRRQRRHRRHLLGDPGIHRFRRQAARRGR